MKYKVSFNNGQSRMVEATDFNGDENGITFFNRNKKVAYFTHYNLTSIEQENN